MALTGKQVIVDLGQLDAFVGTLTQARWEIFDETDGKIKSILASQIAGSGSLDILKMAAPGGDSFPISGLAGKEIKDVGRTGTGSCGFILLGEDDNPTGNDLKWFNNILTYAENMGPLPGEILTIYFK